MWGKGKEKHEKKSLKRSLEAREGEVGEGSETDPPREGGLGRT